MATAFVVRSAYAASVPIFKVLSSTNPTTGTPPAPAGAVLTGVAAVSATDVWAVGYDAAGTYKVKTGIGTKTAPRFQTLVEHFNGATWSIVPSPDQVTVTAGTTANQLFAVSADGSSDVWAVGTYEDVGRTGAPIAQTLVEHFNGSAWSIVPGVDHTTGAARTQANQLEGVEALSPTDVWAVGSYTTDCLAEHFNGTSWALVTTPFPTATAYGSAYRMQLSAISGSSATDLWAAGSAESTTPGHVTPPPGITQTLIEHYNGAAWSFASSPDAGSGVANQLSAVAVVPKSSATAPTDVWAVGSASTGSNGATPPSAVSQALVEHYDGTSWSVVPSPDAGTAPPSQPNHLTGVAAVSGTEIEAVGSSLTGGTVASPLDQTLAEGTPVPTTTTLTTSVTMAITGQSVVLTARVAAPTGPTPTGGSIAFTTGGSRVTGCGTVPVVTGMATCTAMVPGPTSVTYGAQYSGDGTDLGSSGGVTITVEPASTTIAVSATPPTGSVSEAVKLAATVSAVSPGGGVPSGLVSFSEGTLTLCPDIRLSAGTASCSTEFAHAGTVTLEVSYAGNASYDGSASTPLVLTVDPAPTSTTVAVTPDPATAGVPVTLRATVTGPGTGVGYPTGTVAFTDGGTAIGACASVPLSGGVATCTTVFPHAGTAVLAASYQGSADYRSSTSPPVTLPVTVGSLTVSESTTGDNPSDNAIGLSPATLSSGRFQSVQGSLNRVQVSDQRGTEAGWTVTGQLHTDFRNLHRKGNAPDNVIPADFLTWVPSVSAGASGASMTGVTAGPRANLSATTAVPLCSAAKGSGGSTYDCTASLHLSVPPYVASGTYTATLYVVVTAG